MDARRFAMNYGAVLGLVLVALAVIMWSIGIDDKQSIIPGLLNNSLTIAFITYAIIQYRDINNNGFISYGSSLKLGTTIAFFSSIILAFYSIIFIFVNNFIFTSVFTILVILDCNYKHLQYDYQNEDY